MMRKSIFIRICAMSIMLLLFVQNAPIQAFAISQNVTLPQGVHTPASFSKINLGRAGEILVNKSNQEFIIDREDVVLSGCTLPVELSFFYSSYSTEKSRWHFNYDMRLKWTKEGNLQFTYKDGTKDIYKKFSTLQDGKTKWIIPEEFGVFGYISSPADCKDFSQFVLYSKLDGIYYFDSLGRVVKIENDAKTGCINILYDNEKNVISKIIDAQGRQFKLYYNENKLVTQITVCDKSNSPIHVKTSSNKTEPYIFQYVYDKDNNLTNIIYPDGQKIEYRYNNNQIVRIQTVDGKDIEIVYERNKAVHQIIQKAGDKSKVLLEMEKTPNGILLSDEVNTQVIKENQIIDEAAIQRAAEKYFREQQSKQQLTAFSQQKNTKITCDDASSTERYCKKLSYATSEYIYDQISGLPIAVADQNSNQISLDYNSVGDLIKMSAEVADISETIQNTYEYNKDTLTAITHNNLEYNILYDIWGNNSGINIQGKPYVFYTYKDGKASLCESVTYGNGQSLNYFYDEENRLTGISDDHGKNMLFEYEYSKYPMEYLTVTDNVHQTVQHYFSDAIRIQEQNTDRVLAEFYSEDNNTMSISIQGTTISLSLRSITSKTDQSIISYLYKNADLTVDLTIVKNYFDLIKQTAVKLPSGELLSTDISYSEDENSICPYPEKYITKYNYLGNQLNSEWDYDYDANGRITRIYLNGTLYARYEYDEIGQIKLEEDYILKTKTEFQYDKGGNILLKNQYLLDDNTHPKQIDCYAYGDTAWGDKLTKYNDREIIYDGIGNPVFYDGRQYKWANGRNLQTYEDDTYIVQYTYDDSNRRQTKMVYNKKTNQKLYQYQYYWNSDFIIAYSLTDYTNNVPRTDVVAFQYDDSGNIYSFTVNDEAVYLYEKNAMGDIVGIISNGELIAKYHYDCYGNVYTLQSSDNVSKYNILYYRGYIYDKETDLYSLQSRYYVPSWGRFLNADIYVDTGTGVLGTNMFAYCENNPINKIDPTGFWGVDLHEKLTNDVFGEEDLSSISLNCTEIAKANKTTDALYSAVVFFLVPEFQGRHFDRHILVSDANGDDTRAYYAGQHIANAVDAYKVKDYSKANKQLGYALHCTQDYSAHGNIGVDNLEYASHAACKEVDYADYNWKDNQDRGKSMVLFCVYKVEDEYGKRYKEAQEVTAWMLIIFLHFINE